VADEVSLCLLHQPEGGDSFGLCSDSFGLSGTVVPQIMNWPSWHRIGCKGRPLQSGIADTVYGLFKSGELPGRKVGRKWVTTKAAVLRWIENSSADDRLARAVERGDRDALAKALNTGKARVKSRSPS
jgi:Helix-turn-helix domain